MNESVAKGHGDGMKRHICRANCKQFDSDSDIDISPKRESTESWTNSIATAKVHTVYVCTRQNEILQKTRW